MSMSYAIAQEGIFDPEATVETLLAAVKENITSKVTSVDQAADLENRLSEEAAEFNAMLSTISNAMRQCEAGEITKEEALAAAKPCVDALKERCEALKLGDVNVQDDDITENEIAMLREYIVGCKDIVAAHKEELQDCAITQNEENSEEASEGVLSYLGTLDVANEASLMLTIRKSNDAKNATELYKNAKKLYAMGSKEKAKSYMEQAKAKYQKCLDTAKKAGRPHTVERTVKSAAVSGGAGYSVADKDRSYTAFKTPGAAYVVRYFEDRVDSCEAYLRQWANKAGNKDFQETKAMLKRERQEERARIRAAAEAAYEEYLETLDFIEACESLMDGYEMDLAMEASLEALNEDTDLIATEAAASGTSIRESCSKMRHAKNQKEFEDAKAEATASMNELADKLDNEREPEKKKRLSLGAKIAIIAGAALLAAAGITVGGYYVQKGKDLNVSGGAAAKLLANMSNAIRRVPFKAMAKYYDKKASKGPIKLTEDGPTINAELAKANKKRYILQGQYDKGVRSNDLEGRLNAANARQKAINDQAELMAKAQSYRDKATGLRSYGKTGDIIRGGINSTARAAALKTGELIGRGANMVNSGKAKLNEAKNIANAGRNTTDKSRQTNKTETKSVMDYAKMVIAKNNNFTINDVPADMRAEVQAKVNTARNKAANNPNLNSQIRYDEPTGEGPNRTANSSKPDYQRKYKNYRPPIFTGSEDAFIDLDGVDFLTMLAMEEANFDDDVALTDIENEEGRGFDDEAQGEDLIDEAIVGEDDLDDVDEADESVLESTLAIFKVEDGLDPDED